MIRVLFATENTGSGPPGRTVPADTPDLVFEVIRPASIRAAVAALRPHVVWIDGEDTAPPLGLDRLQALDAPILLTRAAVTLAAQYGRTPDGPPSDRVDRAWHDDEDEQYLHTDVADIPRLRGHACFRRHRIFGGLGGGVHTWCPREGEPFRAWTWRRPQWPELARVIAVERASIHINPDRATVWEYPRAADHPHTVCIGAYLPLETVDPRLRPRVHRLLSNTLLYLAGRMPEGLPDLYWEVPDTRTIEDGTLYLPASGDPVEAAVPVHPGPLPLELAALRRASDCGDEPFTVAGRRTLVTGRELDGVQDIWIHPIRVATAVRAPGTRCSDVIVTPLGVERALRVEDRPITERIWVPVDTPAVLLEYERPDRPGPGGTLEFRLEWISDLRLMWPYPAHATGPLRWRVHGDTLAIRSGRTDESVHIHAFVVPAASPVTMPGGGHPQPPGHREAVRLTACDAGRETDPAAARLQCSLTADLRPGDRLRVLIAARVHEADDPAATLRVLRSATALVRARAGSLRRLQRERLSVRTADERVGQAIEWAKARLDGFLVESPGVGRSLVAGYSAARPGWNDGRPGYAWYSARDSAWTAFASLACGDFDAARDTCAFLGEHQDVTGEILHDCTTSGSMRFDAADSTPLYLLLVARYFAWTGDTNFVRSQWDRVRRAFEFCLLTDRDGDGLIENSRAGHRWLEFGRLGAGHITYCNAGVWTAALRELAITAESIGDHRFAAELGSRSKTARLAIEEVFLDPDLRRYAHSVSTVAPEKSHDWTPTATHAVPLLLGVADADRAGSWLDLVASDEFSTDRGVRLIPRSHPDFDPARYDGGAVNPLLTGWVSWAEFAAGRSRAAFMHWRASIDLAFERARGACPDRAWSTAMAISPFVHGLLGVEPDASSGRLRLRPQLPEDWNRLEVRKLRMGDASVSLGFERDGYTCTFTLEQDLGAVPVRLVFEPVLPGVLVHARVDGQPAQLEARPFGERILVPVQLVLDHVRVVELDIASSEI